MSFMQLAKPALTTAVLSAAIFFGLTLDKAHATVVDFEGATGSASATGDSFNVGGLNFELTDLGLGFLQVFNDDNFVEPGTTKLFAANHAEITMTLAAGGAFSVSSLDLGGSWVNSPNRWADQVQIAAQLNGGGIFQTLVDLPSLSPTYVTANLNLTNILSLNFAAFGSNGTGLYDYEFTVDNINYNLAAVPLPASLAMLFVGIGALVGLRRKRASTA